MVVKVKAKKEEVVKKTAAPIKEEEVKKAKKIYPEMEIVTDGEGRKVKGFVSKDGKSVMDMHGVTFAM